MDMYDVSQANIYNLDEYSLKRHSENQRSNYANPCILMKSFKLHCKNKITSKTLMSREFVKCKNGLKQSKLPLDFS